MYLKKSIQLLFCFVWKPWFSFYKWEVCSSQVRMCLGQVTAFDFQVSFQNRQPLTAPCKQIGRKTRFLKKIITKEKWLRHCSNLGCFVCSSCGELYSLFTMLKSVSHFTNCFPRCWLCLTMSPSFFTVLFLFLPGFPSFVCILAICILCNFFFQHSFLPLPSSLSGHCQRR